MPRYAHPDVLDNGLNEIVNNCDELWLISSYTAGDSFAACSGRVLSVIARAPGNFALGNSGLNRTLTSAAGQDAAADAAGGGAGNHFVFVDTVGSRVLYATPEASGQAVVAGNPVNFPALVYTSEQPVA